MTSRADRIGLLCAALCAANGALVPAVAKLTTAHASPLFVAAASTLFAGAAALAILGARRQLAPLWDRHLGPRLLAIAVFGTAAAHLFLYAGASRASAIEVTLCLQVEPAYALLLAWVGLGHRPTPRRLLAVVVLLAGIALAIGAAGMSSSIGVWLLFAAPLCWQLSHLVVLRHLVGVPAIVLTGARYVIGGALLACAWWAIDGRLADAAADLRRLLPWLALQGCVLGYAGTLLWYLAIARIDLARATAIVVPSIPLLALVASFALLGEVATPRQWAGIGLTTAGIFAFVAEGERHRPSRPGERPGHPV